MKGKRISREAALRIGAVGLAVAASVAVLPGLLAAPKPPPLAADIGLGASGASGPAGRLAEERRPKDRDRRARSKDHRDATPTLRPPQRGVRPRPEPERQPHRRRHRDRDGGTGVTVVPPPAPPPAPAPAPAAVAVAPPAPPPPVPDPAPGEFGP